MISPSVKLASWRELAATPRQLYSVSRMHMHEVGELAAENRVPPVSREVTEHMICERSFGGAA